MRQQKMQQQLQGNVDGKINVKDIKVGSYYNYLQLPEYEKIPENKNRTGWEEFWTSLKADKNFLSENEKILLTKYFKKEVSSEEIRTIERGLVKEGVYSFDGLLAQNDPKLVAEFLEGLKRIKNAVDDSSNDHDTGNNGGKKGRNR